jgi:NADH-quinone oxidoreductase subunit G
MADYARVDTSVENLVTIELNGRAVSAPSGTMLVDAAYAAGVEVPIFCYEPRLGPPIGACRMCLVEIEGMRGLQTACNTPVAQDMVVRTDSAAVKDAQDGVLEQLLAHHPLDCPVCDKGGECPLQDRTFKFGPGKSRFIEPKRHWPKPLELSSRIALDRERCIRCFRCVRFSQEVAQDGQLTMQERGALSEITTFSGDAYEARFSGNIIDICPVGALTSIPYRFVARPWDVTNTPSVCGLCPVGCNTELTTREGVLKRVSGRDDPNYTVEEGWLCDKGRWGYDVASSDGRLISPVVRETTGDRTADLDDALPAVASLLRGRRVGILLGGTATLEEAGIALDLAANGTLPDAIVARLGVPASAISGLRAHPGGELGDIDDADLVIIIGGDPGVQQPVTELRIRKAHRFGARVIGCGTRPHSLEMLGEFVRTAPDGLTEAIRELAQPVAQATHPIVLWDEADLAADASAADALGALLADNAHALQIALGADVNGVGLEALGIPTTGVFEALRDGSIEALVCVHADPLSAPGRRDWEAALGAFAGPIVAIATHASPTTARADVVLPAFTMWEQEGTLVSMTGRAQRVRPGAAGPPGAAAAWELLVATAHCLGAAPVYRTAASAFAQTVATQSAFAGLTPEAMGIEGTRIAIRTVPLDDAVPAAEDGDGLQVVTTHDHFGDAVTAASHALRTAFQPARVRVHPLTGAEQSCEDEAMVVLASSVGRSGPLMLVFDPSVPAGVVIAPLATPGAPTEGALARDHRRLRVRLEQIS